MPYLRCQTQYALRCTGKANGNHGFIINRTSEQLPSRWANNREEQRKAIRYNHLVANLVVFHNVVSMTRIFQELVDEGYTITPEIIANFSPYRTEHLNRFGSYDVRFDQEPPPIIEGLRLSPDLAVRAN